MAQLKSSNVLGNLAVTGGILASNIDITGLLKTDKIQSATADGVIELGAFKYLVTGTPSNPKFLIADGTTGAVSVDSIENYTTKIIYGTCGTASGTQIKEVTLEDATYIPKTGDILIINFTANNSASDPQLNVNGTGEKPISWNGSTASIYGAGRYSGAYVTYRFDGTNYVFLSISYDSDTQTGFLVNPTQTNKFFAIPFTNVPGLISSTPSTPGFSSPTQSLHFNPANGCFATRGILYKVPQSVAPSVSASSINGVPLIGLDGFAFITSRVATTSASSSNLPGTITEGSYYPRTSIEKQSFGGFSYSGYGSLIYADNFWGSFCRRITQREYLPITAGDGITLSVVDGAEVTIDGTSYTPKLLQINLSLTNAEDSSF